MRPWLDRLIMIWGEYEPVEEARGGETGRARNLPPLEPYAMKKMKLQRVTYSMLIKDFVPVAQD